MLFEFSAFCSVKQLFYEKADYCKKTKFIFRIFFESHSLQSFFKCTHLDFFLPMIKDHDSVAQYRPDNDYEQMVQTFTTIGLAAVLPGIWCIVTSMAPFAAFQWFGFAAFCKLQKHEMGNFPEEVIEYGQIHNLTMPGQEDKPTWCYEEPPIPYIHVGGMPQFKEPFRLGFCVLNFLSILPDFLS